MLPDPDDPCTWLGYAHEDAEAAELILHTLPELTGKSGFHIQQAIEKTLKAYLIWKGLRAPHIHNIEALLHLCGQEEFLEELADGLIPTTFFAVEARYPGTPQISEEETKRAFEAMKKLMDWADRLMGE